jgi:uncharacterized protein (DUF1697 family)
MRYVVLLRGINVGSSDRIPMAGLREALEVAGFEDPRTYLQSGNVMVDSSADHHAVEATVARTISDAFGLDVAVLALTAPELARVVAENPYAAQAAADPTRVHAMFASPMPGPQAFDVAEAAAYHPEEYVPGPGVIYLHLPQGIGRAKLPAVLEKVLAASTVTTRNWRTVDALMAMIE